MSQSERTHYDVLGVHPSASLNKMQIAYENILRDNKIENLGPFSTQRAWKINKDANVAWEILSNWNTRSAYNEKIGVHPKENPERGSPRQREGSSYDGGEDRKASTEEVPVYNDPVSRYMESDTGTVVDIIIRNWRLKLNISSKFRFLNDVTELSGPRDNDTISFQMGLAYNTNSRETVEATINEFTVKIESVPADKKGWCIARIQTIFKESISDMPSLTLTITAKSLDRFKNILPWEFGFDFDYNGNVQSHRRGTCLFFNLHEYPDYFRDYVGADSAEFELKKDKDVNATTFKDMGSEKCMKLRYGSVEMWRLAAVGWRG